MCWSLTHSSVVSLGRPLGSVVRPLLLQRTTVSRQEHSAGHLSTGEQLFSSLPDERWMDREVRKGDRKVVMRNKNNAAGLQMLKCKSAPSHHLHRRSPAQLHPGWGSPSGNKDSGSEGYRWRCVSFSANHRAKPGDSYSWRDWPEGFWITERRVGWFFLDNL